MTAGRWYADPEWDVDDCGPRPTLQMRIHLWHVVTHDGEWTDCFTHEHEAQELANTLNRDERMQQETAR